MEYKCSYRCKKIPQLNVTCVTYIQFLWGKFFDVISCLPQAVHLDEMTYPKCAVVYICPTELRGSKNVSVLRVDKYVFYSIHDSWNYRACVMHTNSRIVDTPFIHSIHSIGTCRMLRFPAILRSFFHSSLLYTFSFHPFSPTSLPSSLNSSCHLFLGLCLSVVVSKCIYNTFFGKFYFLPLSVHVQTNIIYLTLLCLL